MGKRFIKIHSPSEQTQEVSKIRQFYSDLHSTTLTQFWLPNSFGTQSQQEGSFSQLPSTRKRYSYLPGFKERVVFHNPFIFFFIRFVFPSQLLKSPAR